MKAQCTQNTDRECREEDCCLDKKTNDNLLVSNNSQLPKNKTRLIPFNYAKYKAGAKAVFRNSSSKILLIHKRHSCLWPIFIVTEDESGCAFHGTRDENGLTDERLINDEDILLEVEPLEEKTFYVNLYQYEPDRIYKYDTLNEAKNARNTTNDCIGTLKITYTEEDLIK